jgi:hypothetical protein
VIGLERIRRFVRVCDHNGIRNRKIARVKNQGFHKSIQKQILWFKNGDRNSTQASLTAGFSKIKKRSCVEHPLSNVFTTATFVEISTDVSTNVVTFVEILTNVVVMKYLVQCSGTSNMFVDCCASINIHQKGSSRHFLRLGKRTTNNFLFSSNYTSWHCAWHHI